LRKNDSSHSLIARLVLATHLLLPATMSYGYVYLLCNRKNGRFPEMDHKNRSCDEERERERESGLSSLITAKRSHSTLSQKR